MNKKLVAIRGAVCAENTSESIARYVSEMCSHIFCKNNITPSDIVSIHFSLTSDLGVLNPAKALRETLPQFSSCALFCTQEANIVGMLPKTIRVMVTAYLDEGRDVVHAYMNGAEVLRPDRKS